MCLPPPVNHTEVIYDHKDHTVREHLEAYNINVVAETCISKTFITLHEKKHTLISSIFQ